MLSSIHSLARRVKGQNVYSVPTLLTRTSGETGSSCDECKVFSFAVLPPHLPRGDHRGDRNPDPSVGEHRRMVPVGTTGRAALDAVGILLTHCAQNNVTFVPCRNRWRE